MRGADGVCVEIIIVVEEEGVVGVVCMTSVSDGMTLFSFIWVLHGNQDACIVN